MTTACCRKSNCRARAIALLGLAMSIWLIKSSWDAVTLAVVSALVGAMVLLLATGHVVLDANPALQDPGVAGALGSARCQAVRDRQRCREAVEIALFLNSSWPAAGTTATLSGAALGAAAAVSLTLIYRRVTARVDLALLFQLSTLVLALLAIQLLLGGLSGWLQAAAAVSAEGTAVRVVASPFLEGGRWYYGMCAALMLLPVLAVIRTWWCESAAR